MNADQWSLIAKNYDEEREFAHTACFTIDDLIVGLARGHCKNGVILDYGAGSGKITRQLYDGRVKIVSFEPMIPMYDILTRLTPSNNFPNISTVASFDLLKERNEKYNVILCVNVFDHVGDIPSLLDFFKKSLAKDGLLILSIPHPMKNIGSWVKRLEDGDWKYDYYRIDGYMEEREVVRTREDRHGNTVVREVRSHHRKLSTYFNWTNEAGFNVRRMHEPGVVANCASVSPALEQQLSKIPYFLIMECVINM